AHQRPASLVKKLCKIRIPSASFYYFPSHSNCFMNKTWLIIKREYLSRVRKKTFILTTFLTPLLFIGLIAAIVFITIKGTKPEKIAVGESNGLLEQFLSDDGNIKFVFVPNADTSLLSRDY